MPENEREFKEKVQKLVGKYEEELASAGIKIDVSRRYFEDEVREYGVSTHDPRRALLVAIERSFYEKRERKYYKYERNKNNCILLSVLPVEKSLVPKEYCKEYAFVYWKKERAYIGKAPEVVIYEEEKLLGKIEKRILKVLKSAKERGVEKACKDTPRDAARYCLSTKYGQKKRIMGKARSTWEWIVGSVLIAFIVIVAVAVVLVGRHIVGGS